MHLYLIDTGKFFRWGEVPVVGYSGFGPYKNDPSAVRMVGLGPLPPGAYVIGPPRDTDNLGPFVLDLFPAPGTNTYGRDAFRIHGDSHEHPGLASHGCIILPRPVREKIVNSGDRQLIVLPGGVS